MANESARRLRRDMTDAEKFVWSKIRHKQMEGFRFRRQHPMGPYIVDFICLEQKLIVELDGSQHLEQAEHDERRTQWLNERGYRVVRFWNFQVFTEWESVEEEIYRRLTEEPQNPPP